MSAHIAPLKVLDPACGDGRFLRVVSSALKIAYPSLVVHCYGVDIDADAAEIARRSLTGTAGTHIAQADAIIDDDDAAQKMHTVMMPWRMKFHLIIGNPPWVSLKGKHRSDTYRPIFPWLTARYRCDTYRTNLFELFIRRSLELLLPGGVLAFVLPDRLIHNRQYTALCTQLHTATSIVRIVTNVVFPGITSDAMILVLRNTPPSGSPVIFEHAVTRKTVSTPHALFPRAHAIAPNSIGSRFCIATGVIVRRGSISDTRNARHRTRIIKGSDIAPGRVRGSHYFTGKKGDMIGGTMDMKKLTATPRVLVRKTGAILIAAFDASDALPEQSLYSITDPAGDRTSLVALADYLNSPKARSIARTLLTNAASFPHLKRADLATLPLPASFPKRTQ